MLLRYLASIGFTEGCQLCMNTEDLLITDELRKRS